MIWVGAWQRELMNIKARVKLSPQKWEDESVKTWNGHFPTWCAEFSDMSVATPIQSQVANKRNFQCQLH